MTSVALGATRPGASAGSIFQASTGWRTSRQTTRSYRLRRTSSATRSDAAISWLRCATAKRRISRGASRAARSCVAAPSLPEPSIWMVGARIAIRSTPGRTTTTGVSNHGAVPRDLRARSARRRAWACASSQARGRSRPTLPRTIDRERGGRVSSSKHDRDGNMDEVIVVGAGIGGLTLGIALHQAGIPCRIFESAAELKAVGVGINLLPHATRELAALGLEDALAKVAIETADATFFNRFGQLIYQEPLGRAAGYDHPQFSIHRGDLQMVLREAFRERAGGDGLVTNRHCLGVEQDEGGVTVRFSDGSGGAERYAVRGRVAIACDGINSVLRKQFFPEEGEPRYSGVNMWRGVTRWTPILSGASMIRAGWLSHGKMVIYPIRAAGADGLQLVNWVAEIETPVYRKRDWNRNGALEDFIKSFADWHFDWLDVPAFIRAADGVLEFPMVDQDPLPRWSFVRVTLLGDAAHPMVPRGSNGAGQAILDVRALTAALLQNGDPVAALAAYEAQRREATARIVLANRTNPPDAILREVFQRTHDRPFRSIDDVISRAELVALSEGYKQIAGYAKEALSKDALRAR